VRHSVWRTSDFNYRFTTPRGGSRPTSNAALGGRLRFPSRASGESMADLVSGRTRTRFRDLATSSTLGQISSAFQDEGPGLMSVAET
jgi:hypothetical protein